mmetsp:Transcript_17909/g.33956  ORF Transcript_17909/g.33956 Transcript_17909/m.33956 type:complete len:144 (+) Transcript_17909:312-743(+)
MAEASYRYYRYGIRASLSQLFKCGIAMYSLDISSQLVCKLKRGQHKIIIHLKRLIVAKPLAQSLVYERAHSIVAKIQVDLLKTDRQTHTRKKFTYFLHFLFSTWNPFLVLHREHCHEPYGYHLTMLTRFVNRGHKRECICYGM